MADTDNESGLEPLLLPGEPIPRRELPAEFARCTDCRRKTSKAFFFPETLRGHALGSRGAVTLFCRKCGTVKCIFSIEDEASIEALQTELWALLKQVMPGTYGEGSPTGSELRRREP